MHDSEAQTGAGQSGLDLGPVVGDPPSPYRVLARKYRPQTFADLIGQEAMVRTLSNAFASGRIPQAWVLTGVRGIGKTTTARILARALNFQIEGPDTGPTLEMPRFGLHCQPILESRHVDVIEMDAASHNGVDDVRQINDAVRYAPISARYKVYILDEVHMLTPQAFNALLKTLEEPPPHAKFVFATTEIRKVPVTVLSRCQRFDLRRVDASLLVEHLGAICRKEGVAFEDGALAIIARAAEGSVRDALSLLDQAIAHSGTDAHTPGLLRADDVRQMLGLADRGRLFDLFEALMRGDAASALTGLSELYIAGADPITVLADLADLTHFVTRVKIVPAVANDPSLADFERARGKDFAAALSIRVLSLAWQMLLKGHAEAQEAPKPISAAEMVLVRIAYAANLPTPDEAIRALRGEERPGGTPPSPPRETTNRDGPAPIEGRANLVERPARDLTVAGAKPRAAPRGDSVVPMQSNAEQAPAQRGPEQPRLERFEDLVALAGQKRDLPIRTALERDIRVVRYEPGRLEIALEPSASRALVGELSRKLAEWTGQRWMVVVSAEQGAPTLRAQQETQRAELLEGVHADPLVRAVLARFPGAEIVNVRRLADESTDMKAGPADAFLADPDAESELGETDETASPAEARAGAQGRD